MNNDIYPLESIFLVIACTLILASLDIHLGIIGGFGLGLFWAVMVPVIKNRS